MDTSSAIANALDGSSALNLGSSVASIALAPFDALIDFMGPFVQIADGLSTLLGLIA
ncbi:hypothetical protein [Corynebacterium senegalense]|uniref:hypothetical protein n=1 Tax=Corynebacterium senegalense TaxID=2080750 RepID=UPI0015F277AE|nr:hypothetical protein [Corynebacterium senegalense]